MSDLDFTTYGLSVGQWIGFRARLPWYRRAWRWFARVVLRRKLAPAGFARIVAVKEHTITLDRPIEAASGEIFVSKFTKGGVSRG